MKRKTILMAALSVMLAGSVNAQIVVVEENRDNNRLTLQSNEILNNNIDEITGDDIAPLGSGALLLAAMSGLYLSVKRKGKSLDK